MSSLSGDYLPLVVAVFVSVTAFFIMFKFGGSLAAKKMLKRAKDKRKARDTIVHSWASDVMLQKRLENITKEQQGRILSASVQELRGLMARKEVSCVDVMLVSV